MDLLTRALYRSAIACVLIQVLAACGGGGSHDTSAPAQAHQTGRPAPLPQAGNTTLHTAPNHDTPPHEAAARSPVGKPPLKSALAGGIRKDHEPKRKRVRLADTPRGADSGTSAPPPPIHHAVSPWTGLYQGGNHVPGKVPGTHRIDALFWIAPHGKIHGFVRCGPRHLGQPGRPLHFSGTIPHAGAPVEPLPLTAPDGRPRGSIRLTFVESGRRRERAEIDMQIGKHTLDHVTAHPVVAVSLGDTLSYRIQAKAFTLDAAGLALITGDAAPTLSLTRDPNKLTWLLEGRAHAAPNQLWPGASRSVDLRVTLSPAAVAGLYHASTRYQVSGMSPTSAIDGYAMLWERTLAGAPVTPMLVLTGGDSKNGHVFIEGILKPPREP